MNIIRKVATRQNGGDPVEAELGAEAINVRMPNGEPLPGAVEPPLKRAGAKSAPMDSDTLVITDSAAGHATKRLTLTALKTWFKADFDAIYLGKTGDGGDLKPTYSEAASRANIYSGLTLKVILGRIQKYFSDLKTVAFSGSYTDLSHCPTSMAPTNHASSHAAGGADSVTPAAIGAIPTTARGAANGVAPLGSDGKIATSYLQPTDDALTFGATSGVAGKFDRLSTAPTATTALRYNGYFRATRIFGVYFSDSADYAEAYKVKGKTDPGDLIAVGPKGVLQRNTKVFNPHVIGFVSEDYAMLIGGKGTPIALAGRIPVKVVGIVHAGDFLAASATPGAVLATSPDRAPRGSIVAMALEDKLKDGPGKVLAFMMRM